MEKTVAVIGKEPHFDKSVRLFRFTKKECERGNVPQHQIRIAWDNAIGGIDMSTNEVKEDPKFQIYVHKDTTGMNFNVTKAELQSMIDYIDQVESQVGNVIDFKTSFIEQQ